MTDHFTILHISDVHFGVGDHSGDQPRIAEQLIETVHNDGLSPRLVIFSGDLANMGAPDEFKIGEHWLKRLLRPEWNATLIVVPGNHDVERARTTRLLFRKAAEDEDVYAESKSVFLAQCPHLDAFFNWHHAARATLPLREAWTNKLGFSHFTEEHGFPLDVIALNSALLSCDSTDEKNLIIDPKFLNESLEGARSHKGLVIAVAHHPPEFLRDWNREKIETLLAQRIGVHLFLHGHLHASSGSYKSNYTGSDLTTLASGASYQQSPYEQSFAYYSLDFDRREINPKTYTYSAKSGDWTLDPTRSRTFVAGIPLFRPAISVKAAPARSEGASSVQAAVQNNHDPPPKAKLSHNIAGTMISNITSNPSPMSGENKPTSERKEAMGDLDQSSAALQLREVARDVQQRLLYYFMEMEELQKLSYALKYRVKSFESIIRKFNDRFSKDKSYKLGNMPDICGFRVITYYPDQIPIVIGLLLNAVKDNNAALFVPDRLIDLEINSSGSDPLSITDAVKSVAASSGLRPTVVVKNRPTGYSSIHLTFSVRPRTVEFNIREMRVEVQVRTALEDVWGEIDHKLRYSSKRGDAGISWNSHLNILKSLIDSLLSYIDVIKRHAEEEADSRKELRVMRSVNTPEAQMDRLAGLPARMKARLREAFDLWEDAEMRRREGKGDPGKFRKAADVFEGLLAEFPNEPATNERLAEEFLYVVEIESAYLLFYTGDKEDLDRAEELYLKILSRRQRDATAHYRVGTLYRQKREVGKSLDHLGNAMEFIERGIDSQVNKAHWLYDSVRLGLALSQWHILTDEKQQLEVRRAALGESLRLSYDVIMNQAEYSVNTRTSALNDFLYYYCWDGAVLDSHRELFKCSDADLLKYQTELYEKYKEAKEGEFGYERLDTLIRIFNEDCEKVRPICLAIEERLEKASLKRTPRPITAKMGTRRWLVEITRHLDTNQADALIFAEEILDRCGRGQPATE